MPEQDIEQQEAIIPDENLELEPEQDNTEDVETLKARLAEKEAFARQAIARAKKAEAEAKALKEKPQAPQDINNTSSDDVDVKILKVQGIPQDEIDYLQKIARVNGTNVIEARNDELFKAYLVKKEADAKAQKARLGASRGSGTVKKEKGFNTPGLSKEEHRALWRESEGL